MSDLASFEHIESRCPQCNYKLDGSMHVHGGKSAMPEEGDFSVCVYCGQVLVYQSDLKLRKITREKISELMADSKSWATIEKAQSFIRRRGKFA